MPRKKFRVVERRDDATKYRCVDEQGTEELIVYKDPAVEPLRYLWGGLDLDAIAANWEAANPANKMLVPDDAGQKVWTSLEPEQAPGGVKMRPIPPEHAGRRQYEPAPEPALEPAKKKRRKREPAPVPAVSEAAARTARAVAMQVHASGSRPRERFFSGQGPSARADTEAALNHAVGMNWVAVSGDRIVKGAVSPHPMTALPTENDPARGPSRAA